MAASGSILKYVKKAFLYHWNLLALGATTAVAVISGKPDIIMPFVAAVEILFLATLSTHPRFQAAIDAEELKSATMNKADEMEQKKQMILDSLSHEDREHYEKLKSMCIQLRRISFGKKITSENRDDMIEDLRKSGVNRLLWIYLRLLFSKNALDRFFKTVDEDEIAEDIKRAKKRLDELKPLTEEETPGQARRRKSLEDTLETSEQRLKNYNMAQENYGLIELELERLYSKILKLSEMSINRQDSDFITSEVDSVSASIKQTEKAMNELDFITGMSSSYDEMPPALLDEEQVVEE